MKETTNYKFKKPELSDTVTDTIQGMSNFLDDIDANLKIQEDNNNAMLNNEKNRIAAEDTRKSNEDIRLNEFKNIKAKQYLYFLIKDTKQYISMDTDGKILKVEHKNSNGNTVRTDTFKYELNKITETRKLNTGEMVTFIYNVDENYNLLNTQII